MKDDLLARTAAFDLQKALDPQLPIEEVEELDENASRIYLSSQSTADSYQLSRYGASLLLNASNIDGFVASSRVLLGDLEDASYIVQPSLYQTPVAGQVDLEAKEKLSVMTFNIRVGDDTLGNGDTGTMAARSPRIANCIKAWMPDTVGIQEASDYLVERLKNYLNPQYEVIGQGRESSCTGESNNILYNRDAVTLLEGGTKWLSDTPDVPGSRFADAGNYNRIFTYGIFKRHSDNLVYMHINTHLDLTDPANKKDGQVIDAFASPYKGKMPILLTGDFNCTEDDEQKAYRYLTLEAGYMDPMYEAEDCFQYHTYPQDGYKQGDVDPQVIDFCLKANSGLLFTKYHVDTSPYPGAEGERAQLTSDHYPIYLEATPYEPIVPFNNEKPDSPASIDNGFAMHDHNFNLVRNESLYQNFATVLGYQSETNGTYVDGSFNRTQHFSIERLGKEGGFLSYRFESDEEALGDLNLVMANNNYVYEGTPSLSELITITLNDEMIDLDGVGLPCFDVRQKYEWQNLVLRDLSFQEGENILTISSKGSECPDQLLLEAFSDANLTGVDYTESVNFNYINLGSEQVTLNQLNRLYPNQRSVSSETDDGVDLTITLLNGEETCLKAGDGVSDLDGTVDFANYRHVTIEGSGALTIAYTSQQDGIFANNLTIKDGATVNLTGFNNAKKSGIKVYGTLTVEGELNISTFGYGIAVTNEGVERGYSRNTTTIASTGKVNIFDCANGIYGWEYSSFYPVVIIEGELDIAASQYGIFLCRGGIYIRGYADVSISSVKSSITRFYKLYVGDGEDGLTTNHANLSCVCSNDNVIYSYDGSKTTLQMSLTFNTLGKVLIESTAGKKKCGIQFATKGNDGDRFLVQCADMTIKGCADAMGSWLSGKKQTVTYSYTGDFNKLTVENCNSIYNASGSYGNASFFGAFTANTVNVI